MTNHPAKILIIKTGHSELLEPGRQVRVVSLGDVLRTTPLLRKYEGCHVTWVTDPGAVPLLERIPQISRLLGLDSATGPALRAQEFDTVINLEKDSRILALVCTLRAREILGFRGNNRTIGHHEPTACVPPRAISAFRKRNNKTTQELLFELANSKWDGEEYLLGHPPRATPPFDVALNTEVGRKLPTKKWPVGHWDVLETQLTRAGLSVTRQDRQDPRILRSIPDYIEWVNSSRVIVTGDTLGMHLGIALTRQVVALFGPTPRHEVHFYGRGRALMPVPAPDCAPCVNAACTQSASCMGLIRPDRVFRHVRALVGRR